MVHGAGKGNALAKAGRADGGLNVGQGLRRAVGRSGDDKLPLAIAQRR